MEKLRLEKTKINKKSNCTLLNCERVMKWGGEGKEEEKEEVEMKEGQ